MKVQSWVDNFRGKKMAHVKTKYYAQFAGYLPQIFIPPDSRPTAEVFLLPATDW
jgi:hypothetical protein